MFKMFQMINFILWNIRGLSNKPSQRRIKKLCKTYNLPFIAILEPKSKSNKIDDFRRIIKFYGGVSNSNSKIWFFWRFGITCEVIKRDEQDILLKINHPQLHQSVFCSVVYAKCTRHDIIPLWDSLIVHKSLVNDHPWLITGDFKKGGNRIDLNAVADFNLFISNAGLLEVSYSGSNYTWHNFRERGKVWARLDRGLVSPEWLTTFTNFSLKQLNKACSDHYPLLFSIQTKLDSSPK